MELISSTSPPDPAVKSVTVTLWLLSPPNSRIVSLSAPVVIVVFVNQDVENVSLPTPPSALVPF